MNNPNMYTNKKKNSGIWKYLIVWFVIIIVVFLLIARACSSNTTTSYEWNIDQFQTAMTADSNYDALKNDYHYDVNNVTSIELVEDDVMSVKVSYKDIVEENGKSKTNYYTASFSWLETNFEYTNIVESAINTYKSNGDAYKEKVSYRVASGTSIWTIILTYLPMLIIVIIGIVLFRSMMKAQGGANSTFDFGKSKARLEDASKIRFTDVAGCEDEKEEMKEIVDYLKNPSKYSKSGARIPKGIILKGNPGTGKTLLAKAVAGEASVPFYYISGSDFLEMFVGVGASRVRDMFKKARMTAPCIIFIDEIDAIGRQRGTGLGGGHDEREQTLNQLLVEMDGFDGNSGVIVLAATNRIDVLDPALLRPGRFDRQIEVALPDIKGRIAILQVHARNKTLASDVSLESIAKRTPGFSGAQLENVLNEAAILSVRNKHSKISTDDVNEAIDRVMSGPAKKTKIRSEHSKRLTAYHEAGHAVIGLKVANAETVQKITIIPRGDALGYVLMTPKDETSNQTKSELMDRIVSYLAGRASEEIFFDDVTTGAYDDIDRATKIARAMVTELGMSNLGPVHYEDGQHQVFLGRDYGNNTISGEVANQVDKEVRSIIDECLAKAKKTIEENKDLLVLIAEALIKYETITADEIDFLVKYGSLDAYDMFKKNSEELAKDTQPSQDETNKVEEQPKEDETHE